MYSYKEIVAESSFSPITMFLIYYRVHFQWTLDIKYTP